MLASPDIYKEDVDFTALALQYPDFAKRLKLNRQLDFSDPESVRQLTKALLHRDFKLTIDLPGDRLCPPVPNRFNYVLFVQRLLSTTQDDYSEEHHPSRRIVGIDIGTGASAIYPLLACRQNPGWLFLGTEIDEKSYSYAERNVAMNNLEARIKIFKVNATSQVLIPLNEFGSEKFDILITNPPFYTSSGEMLSLAKQKSRPPNSACTGSEVEMITPGGEVVFVSRLIQESNTREARGRIRWYSSMLGKLSSLSIVVERLKEVGCTNYAVTEFIQGQKTRRWCVAWSWQDLRPSIDVARGTDSLEKKLLPFPSQHELIFETNEFGQMALKINAELENLDLMWRWKDNIQTGIGKSLRGDVWSRRARRRKNRREADQDEMEIEDGRVQDEDESKIEGHNDFAFKITLSKQANLSGINLRIRWLQGHDSKIFESFCGWLKRKLDS